MINVDTHAFVWWRGESARLTTEARRRLDRSLEVGVSDIVLWEIAMLIERGVLRIKGSARAWMADALSEPAVRILPITPAIALRAVEIGRVLSRDPADHLIAATALEYDVPLVTADQALAGFRPLRIIW